VLVSLKDNQLN